jgi:hypothetical protein
MWLAIIQVMRCRANSGRADLNELRRLGIVAKPVHQIDGRQQPRLAVTKALV